MPGNAVKEVVRVTPEAAAHQKYPDGLSDEYIFFRMKQWMDDGDKGITFNHIVSRFKTYPTRAIWLLHKFYFENREMYDLKRGWFVEPEVEQGVDDDGNAVEYTGYTATEAQVEEMEKRGQMIKKRLFCIHPGSLDILEEIDSFNSERMDSEVRKPLSTLFESDAAAAKKEKEVEKQKEAVKMQKLFAKECERPKHADPTKKNKYKTPTKSKDEFFSPSKKQKDIAVKPSPLKARRRMGFEGSDKNNAMMDDVFTTGEDDVDMEDIGKYTNELVDNKKTMKPAKIAASNYRPKKMSSRVRGAFPVIASDPLNEDAEMDEPQEEEGDEEPGPSTAPSRIKELRTVQETTRDDEGYLVTTTSKKMVETDKVAPPPAKKKAINLPAAGAKKVKVAPKQQSTLTDFFKKK